MTTAVVGLPVHYRSHGTPIRGDGSQAYTGQCRAAIVAEVPAVCDERDAVSLCVLNPTGVFFDNKVAHARADITVGGTWHTLAECDHA